jgi:hypothetical protein
MHSPGIGPGPTRWQRAILPLNYECFQLQILWFLHSVMHLRQSRSRISRMDHVSFYRETRRTRDYYESCTMDSHSCYVQRVTQVFEHRLVFPGYRPKHCLWHKAHDGVIAGTSIIISQISIS